MNDNPYASPETQCGYPDSIGGTISEFVHDVVVPVTVAVLPMLVMLILAMIYTTNYWQWVGSHIVGLTINGVWLWLLNRMEAAS